MSEHDESAVEAVEETSEAVNAPENEADSQNEESKSDNLPQSQEDMGKVIAGVKKKYREIGRQEGLKSAQETVDDVAPDDNIPSEQPPEPVAQAEVAAAPAQAKQGYDPTTDRMWEQKFYALEARGQAKYPDFDKKFQEASVKAVSNPTLKLMYQYAIGLGDETVIYSLLNDPAKRGRMLEDPSSWNKELFNLSSDEPVKVPTKLAPEPLSQLKVAPATGGKRSFDDQGKWVRSKNKIYTPS